MEIREIAVTAIEALKSNKLRTGLAALGIIIGIAAVVGLISIGKGAQNSITDKISANGSNLLTISPGATNQRSSSGIRGAAGSAKTLTLDDAKAIIANKFSTVKAVSAETSSNFQVTYKKNNTNATVAGVLPDHEVTSNITMQSGVFISESHIEKGSKVAVLGPNIVEDLFGSTTANAIGKTVNINSIPFQVVGITKAKGGSGFGSIDDSIFVPIVTAQKLLTGSEYVRSIYVTATSEKVTDQTMDDVGMFLLKRHKLSDPAKADFSIRSQADLLETVTSTVSIFTNLLAGIAAISLLVGGIGIMNVMLVTITERTKEIGIRKAIGAKRKDILLQFLFESIVLTVVGGLLGIALGLLLSIVAGKIFSITPSFSLYGPLLAFSVSSMVGVIFGYYPARKAALMQPIEALRYE